VIAQHRLGAEGQGGAQQHAPDDGGKPAAEAVEQQATDRTHRIGQEKPVFIYKMIVRDTVEEKMLVLQERKRVLADQLVSSEPGIVKSLTREDVADLFS
jgi:non-specific serine/threonine protein kinase